MTDVTYRVIPFPMVSHSKSIQLFRKRLKLARLCQLKCSVCYEFHYEMCGYFIVKCVAMRRF